MGFWHAEAEDDTRCTKRGWPDPTYFVPSGRKPRAGEHLSAHACILCWILAPGDPLLSGLPNRPPFRTLCVFALFNPEV